MISLGLIFGVAPSVPCRISICNLMSGHDTRKECNVVVVGTSYERSGRSTFGSVCGEKGELHGRAA